MAILHMVLTLIRAFFQGRSGLVLENLALRQQLAVLRRSVKRPKLRRRDRLFWVFLRHAWEKWESSLILVKPETVVHWHRQAFKAFWRWKSRRKKPGRPPLDPEIIALIHRMANDNPTWGAPRITSELLLLGYEVRDTTVAKYLPRRRHGPSSQRWRTFLKNHLPETVACDFFVVPTATFRLLYCFLILSHDRRRIVHFNVTSNPTAKWTAQQMVEAFPGDGPIPKYLIRDRDGIYGGYFRRRVQNMGIREFVTSRRSPWQNPFVERVIGTIRRECLDHVIVLGEDHLRRLLKSYIRYYHGVRPHLSLHRNAPIPRKVEPGRGRVIAIPHVGGLHHHYKRAA
ncbi:MAG: integrase core domain-containing protein [Deltaproteobacteria bacterium]|nr:integrase core domain-containing protein [Deltaproteobacteria bacterium]